MSFPISLRPGDIDGDSVVVDVDITPIPTPSPTLSPTPSPSPTSGGTPDWLAVTGMEPGWMLLAAAAVLITVGVVFTLRHRLRARGRTED